MRSGLVVKLVIEIDGRVVVVFPLIQSPAAALLAAVEAPQTAAQGRAPDEAIAGRIAIAPSPLIVGVESWLSTLAAGRKKPGTVKSYGASVRAAIRAAGWTTCADLTGANITEYLNSKAASGDWPSGATRNRALSAFRSLIRHLRLIRAITDNPLEFAERAEDESRQRVRAATVEEVRALIRHVSSRESADRRGGGQRMLYDLCLFAPGCRPGEPSLWRRRHVLLDEPIPYFNWTAEIQKNKRHEQCAIPPELVPLLRAQREEMRAAAATCPHVVIRNRRAGTTTLRLIDPANPEAYVFAHTPCKSTFNKDREDAGIKAQDARGMGFTQRSARRYFKTQAIAAGIHGDIVRFFMRHKRLPDEVYHDLSLAAQVEALARMPRLCVDGGKESASGIELDTPGDPMYGVTAKKMTNTTSNSSKIPGPEGLRSSSSQSIPAGAWPGIFAEFVQQSGLSVTIAGPGVDSFSAGEAGKGRFGIENPDGIQLLTARFLHALAELLQSGAGRGED